MTISWLGNSSVATVPTLLDLIVKGEMPEHSIGSGDVILFASVGAGMHINAVGVSLAVSVVRAASMPQAACLAAPPE